MGFPVWQATSLQMRTFGSFAYLLELLSFRRKKRKHYKKNQKKRSKKGD